MTTSCSVYMNLSKNGLNQVRLLFFCSTRCRLCSGPGGVGSTGSDSGSRNSGPGPFPLMKYHHPVIGCTVSLPPSRKVFVFAVEEMCEPINPATNIVSNFFLLSISLTSTCMYPHGTSSLEIEG